MSFNSNFINSDSNSSNRFFTHFPEYQQKFKSFANVPISELRGNKRLSAHANNVLYTLTGVIDSIDDTEVFTEMIEKMAENHFRRKIEVKHFKNLGLVIIDLLLEKLGDEIMNQQTIDAWKKAYLVMLELIGNVLDRKASEKDAE